MTQPRTSGAAAAHSGPATTATATAAAVIPRPRQRRRRLALALTHMVNNHVHPSGGRVRVWVVPGVELDCQGVANAIVTEPSAIPPNSLRSVGVSVDHKGESVAAVDSATLVEVRREDGVLVDAALARVVRDLKGEQGLETLVHR